jgi:hypothetical protein
MRKLDAHTGTKERTDLVSCTMTINHIAKNGVEAQFLAWQTMKTIRDLKVLLQRNGMHKVGDEISMTPETPPGSFISGEPDPELVMVSLYCPFFFQWTSTVQPLTAPLAREIELRLRSALLPQAATTTQGRVEARAALRVPSIRGRVINQPDLDHQRVGEITQTVKT